MRKRTHRSQIFGISVKVKRNRQKTPIQASTIKIGQVSKKSGIPIVTLRFYENEGLIQAVKSTETNRSSHRRFAADVFTQLDFIRFCRNAGFSIPEIKSLLRLYRGFKVPSKSRMSALKRSIEMVREQKKHLSRIERVLLYRLRHPEGEPPETLIE